MMNTHGANTPEEWETLFKKRKYYATEIATLVNNLPPDQARKIKENITTEIKSVDDFIKACERMDQVPEIRRMIMLFKKHNENLCCFTCAMVGLVAAFLITKVDQEAPNSSLH